MEMGNSSFLLSVDDYVGEINIAVGNLVSCFEKVVIFCVLAETLKYQSSESFGDRHEKSPRTRIQEFKCTLICW